MKFSHLHSAESVWSSGCIISGRIFAQSGLDARHLSLIMKVLEIEEGKEECTAGG